MVKSHTLRIQRVPRSLAFYLLFSLCFWCPLLWASQEAMVLVDKAMIYSDQEMTSPIGYVSRGKKLMVGEIPRNRAQVYPIIVSGKIAYIRVNDVTTERESMDSTRLTAERFQKSTVPVYQAKFVASYYAFNSTIEIDEDSQGDDDNFFWNGISLKGEVYLKNRFDVGIIINYMQTKKENFTFRATEVGAGAAFRIIDTRRFLFRLEGQLLGIPYSSYAIGDKFRVNSFGYTVGGGANTTIFFNENWAMELFGGYYRTSLFEYDAPEPYHDVKPVFMGLRAGIGVNFTH